MIIRVIPPPPHPPILYPLTFPSVLPLQSLGPGAALPAAWSSQLQLITSVLLLDSPSSIHMLDRAVGLVARTHEVSMDVSQQEITLEFVDGRAVKIPMSSDCVRILVGVSLDVKGCSDHESQRNSMEGSASHASLVGSAEDFPSPSSPTKSPKRGKHKRQRSLLFSLISYVPPFHPSVSLFDSRGDRSLVPKSISSLTSPSPPLTGPPPTPLPPLPATGRVSSPQETSISLQSTDPDILRRRARAALLDVWRRHVIPALSPQCLPAAGYTEWTLIGMAGRVRKDLEWIKAEKMKRSRGFAVSHKRSSRSKHRHTQSEGRNALDFGDRNDDYGPERCRAPSPFPGVLDGEDTDRVVYPRREQADEWGVRYVDHRRSLDEVDIFAFEFDNQNDSLLGEQFTVGDDWDDNERLTFELRRRDSAIDLRSSNFVDRYPHPDFGPDYYDDDSSLADTAFDMSRIPLVPSDVNDDEESDDSQGSLRTPEEGEEISLALPGHTQITHPSRVPAVSRVTSSRPRSRNASSQWSSGSTTHPSAFSTPYSMSIYDSDLDESIQANCEYLERICAALEITRNRSREEGWGLVRATMIGGKNGWIDPETERSLEIKAKRRAWSSGIKIYAPYSSVNPTPRVWDGSLQTFRTSIGPPGLAKRLPRVHGPIVPTGLSLGIPLRSSPLALYACNADDPPLRPLTKYGSLNPGHGLETIERKRTPRVTFADNITKLFPVHEDDSEDIEPANAVGFPQAVAPSANEPEVIRRPADIEDDPFGAYPSQPRMRTTSMYMVSSTPSSPSLPIFRPSTPPPSCQATLNGDRYAVGNKEATRLEPSALLLQPLSSLTISPSPRLPSRPPLASGSPFMSRPRAVSLPVNGPSCASANKSRRTSLHKGGRYEDLSRTYASPPPEGPLIITATSAPHEQYPRYAHVYSPILTSKTVIHAPIPARTGKEVVFEQAGSEFTVGIEVALGRAEEGRVVW